MSYLSSFGAASVFTPDMARSEIDMTHNAVPFITCEGRCSKERVTWTTHDLLSEHKVAPQTFQQDYACGICGHARTFGLTHSRVTPKGESN